MLSQNEIIEKIRLITNEYDFPLEDSALLSIISTIDPESDLISDRNKFNRIKAALYPAPKIIQNVDVFFDDIRYGSPFNKFSKELYAGEDPKLQKKVVKNFQDNLHKTLEDTSSKEKFNQSVSRVFDGFTSARPNIQRKNPDINYDVPNFSKVHFIFAYVPFDLLNEQNQRKFVDIGKEILFYFGSGYYHVCTNNVSYVIRTIEEQSQLIDSLLNDLEKTINCYSHSDLKSKSAVRTYIAPIIRHDFRKHMSSIQVNRLLRLFQTALEKRICPIKDFIACLDPRDETDINAFLQMLEQDFKNPEAWNFLFSTRDLIEIKPFLDILLISRPTVKKPLERHIKTQSERDWHLYNEDVLLGDFCSSISALQASLLRFENIAYVAKEMFNDIFLYADRKNYQDIAQCLLVYLEQALMDDDLLKKWIEIINLMQFLYDNTNKRHSTSYKNLFEPTDLHRVTVVLALNANPTDSDKIAACHACLYETKILQDYADNHTFLEQHWLSLKKSSKNSIIARLHLEAFYELILWSSLYHKKTFQPVVDAILNNMDPVDSYSAEAVVLTRIKSLIKDNGEFIPNQELYTKLTEKKFIILSVESSSTVSQPAGKEFPTKMLRLFLSQYEARKVEGEVTDSEIIIDLKNLCQRNPERIDLSTILCLNSVVSFNREDTMNTKRTASRQLLKKIDRYIITMLNEPDGLRTLPSSASQTTIDINEPDGLRTLPPSASQTTIDINDAQSMFSASTHNKSSTSEKSQYTVLVLQAIENYMKECNTITSRWAHRAGIALVSKLKIEIDTDPGITDTELRQKIQELLKKSGNATSKHFTPVKEFPSTIDDKNVSSSGIS